MKDNIRGYRMTDDEARITQFPEPMLIENDLDPLTDQPGKYEYAVEPVKSSEFSKEDKQMPDKKEYGDGLEALTTRELLTTLTTELDQLRLFWRKFFNAKFDNIDEDDINTGITFNIDYAQNGFTIDIQNNGFYVCQLEYVWAAAANANMLNINMLNSGNGELQDCYKGFCMRANDYPKLNYWDESELKAATSQGYKYLWDFMSRLYIAIQEAMRDKWIASQKIDEEMKHTKYNGIISRPIFDPQFLEPGALIQIYIKDDSALKQPPLMFKKGYYYNAFVLEQSEFNTKLKVVVIDHRDKERKATNIIFSVDDVTSEKIEIIRVK